MRVLVVSADRTMPNGWPANLGDAWLTDGLLQGLRDLGHDPRAADFGSPRHGGSGPRSTVAGVRGLARAVASADAVIVGGGTMLQDDVGAGGINGLPRLCLTVSALCRLLGRPMAYVGVGAETPRRGVARLTLREALRGRDVWVREAWSERAARDLGGRAHLGADLAWLARVPATHADARSATPVVLVALNRRDLPELVRDAPALLAMWRGVEPCLLAMDQRSDAGDTVAVPWAASIDGPLGWAAAATHVARARCVIASRMHALYLAAACGTPMIAVGTSHKVRRFAQEFDVPLVDAPHLASPSLARAAGADAISRAADRARTSLAAALSTLDPHPDRTAEEAAHGA